MISKQTLIYVHDPMCSWCYGYKPILNTILENINKNINVQFLLGGLAVDTQKVMPKEMQNTIRSNWYKIEKDIPGTIFNYDFWNICIPKRSTYLSCRAVIAASRQDTKFEKIMIDAIQTAYYRNAQNPSDVNVLYNLAEIVNLNVELFIRDIHSKDIEIDLRNQISLCNTIGAHSFPSLYLRTNTDYLPLELDYNNADFTLSQIEDNIVL